MKTMLSRAVRSTGMVLRRARQYKNRVVTWFYHFTHGIKTSTRDYEHMRECRHCREGFEKWKAENAPVSDRREEASDV